MWRFCYHFVTETLASNKINDYLCRRVTKATLMRTKRNYEKEPVTIRYKALANGNKSIYLDTYMGGRRQYEFLRLYLVPETGRDKAAAKRKNQETMSAVNAIVARKILDIKNGKAGVANGRGRLRLVDWLDVFRAYKERTAKSEESRKTVDNMRRHLVKYAGEETLMSEVDKKFCLGWIAYLKGATKRGGKPLATITKKVYLTCFGTALNKAVRDGIIPINPLTMIDAREKISMPESERVFLDIEEVRKLAATDCYSDLSKRAFMFSCFSGLRISDIRKLRWTDIEEVTDADGERKYRLSKTMEKTQRVVSYQLSKEAVRWLPERVGELVFHDLTKQSNLNNHVRKWAEDAGISKHVSFHTARHTFATMMLTLGADIYTTSKLLGHSRVSTTEIYAKIIDKKKDEAMGLIDKFFDKE